jgi:hypothetical protein
MLFEVLRFETGLTTAGDPYKLNNDYRAHYSRMMMEREEDLRGLFETRGGRDPFGHRINPAQLPLDNGAFNLSASETPRSRGHDRKARL